MSTAIPARETIIRWAVNASAASCLWCGHEPGDGEVPLALHHDHLLDFALQRLRELQPADVPEGRTSWLWQSSLDRFRPMMRFDPALVCDACNQGDGWAKTEGWCGEGAPVYPSSFSMTLPELESMRRSTAGASRRRMAERIWRVAEVDHSRRRDLVAALAGEIAGPGAPARAA